MTHHTSILSIRPNSRRWSIVLLGGVLGLLQPAVAEPLQEEPTMITSQLDTLSITLPDKTVEGKLENGLHYLILPNATPSHTVEMRLVMRVGAVQETEKQKGCAHFLEHMAFAGTRHFPQRSMIDYLESLGMKFGRDINAVTGYDRTVFMLTVPMRATDLGVLDSTLLVLKDWLTGIDFKSNRVKQERGVILEELRTYRNDDVFYDLKIGQSRFKERMPLGSADDIRKVERKDLIKFYKKWYTPQLASVVVVGEVDAAETEKRIHRLFNDISPKAVEDYQRYPLSYSAGVQMMEVRDSIKQKSVVEMIVPHVGITGKDFATTLRKEQERLTAYALDRRFSARHLSCTVSDDWYLSDTHHFVLSFSGAGKENLLKKITRVASEMRLLLNTGWVDEEMARIKEDFTEALPLIEEGKHSAIYCEDFTDYILQGDRYVHHQEEMDRLRRALQATAPTVLQQHLSSLMEDMKKTLLLAYRNNSGIADSLTTAEILAAWETGFETPAPPYVFRQRTVVEKTVSTPLCLSAPIQTFAEAVVSEEFLPNTKITDVRLANGMRLIFRPTPEADETLLINFLGKGGLAYLHPEDYHLYESTAGFLEMGGISKVPYDTLCDYMAQEGLLMNLSISAYWHDLLGTAPAGHSLELFNLINEKLHRPELCRNDFEEVRADELKSLGEETILDQMMQRAPDRLLINRLDSLVGNSPSTWFREKTPADLQRMNLDSIADYFCRLYGQLQGTTVILTGNYDLEKVKEQAVALFGHMKNGVPHPAMTTHIPPFDFPQKKWVESFDHDHPSQTVLEYVYPGHFKSSLKNGLTLKLMRDLLQDRMLRVLREQENVVYSPYASLYYYGAPQNSFYFNLSLSIDAENSKRTDVLVHDIIAQLQEETVTEEELNKMKRAFLVNKHQTLTEGAATEWRNILATLVKNDERILDFEHYEQQLEGITPETVRKAFREYLVTDREILLYMGKHQMYDR